MQSFFQEIYDEGGRKFAFQNVGPLGCQPMTKSLFPDDGQCIDLLLQLPSWHNTLLRKALEEMAQELSEFKYSIFDYYNALLDRILNPTKHGKNQTVDD